MTTERLARKLADDDLLEVLDRQDTPEPLRALIEARLVELAAQDDRTNLLLPAG